MNKCIVFIMGCSLLIFVGCFGAKKSQSSEEGLKPVQVNYINSVKPIIKRNCQSCHSGSYPAGGAALTTYKQVRDQSENGQLLQRIRDVKAPMPKSGLMDEDQIQLIEQWAKEGYKLDSGTAE